MKKVMLYMLLLLFAVGSLSGCGEDLFTTKEYRQMKGIYKQIEDGKTYTKDDLYSKMLGCPEGYYGVDEKYTNIPFEDREAIVDVIYGEEVDVWIYTCYELSDPANPYRLKITFDSEGNAIQAEFDFIPGG